MIFFAKASKYECRHAVKPIIFFPYCSGFNKDEVLLFQQQVKRKTYGNESVAFSQFAEEIRLEPTVKFDVSYPCLLID